MRVGINAGFDGGLANDLPQIAGLRYQRVRRDVPVSRAAEFFGEFKAYPYIHLGVIHRSAFDCAPAVMADEALVLAITLKQAGFVGRCSIEIGNEPNISKKWAETPASFSGVVNACAKAIWAVDPGIEVISGGVSNTGATEQLWLKRAVAGMHADIIIGYHTYRTEDPPDTPLRGFATRDAEDESLIAIIGARRCALTEFGWHTKEWTKKFLGHVYKRGQFTYEQQATFCEQEIKRAVAIGAMYADWYQLQDAPEDGNNGFGIRFLSTSEPKPVAHVAAKFWTPEPIDNAVTVLFRVVDGTAPVVGAKFSMRQDDGTVILAVSDDKGIVTFRSSTPGWGCWVDIVREGFDPIHERRILPAVTSIADVSWYTVMSRPVATLTVSALGVMTITDAKVHIEHDSSDVPVFKAATNTQGQVAYQPSVPGWGVWINVTQDGYLPFRERGILPMVSDPEWFTVEMQPVVTHKDYSKAQLNLIQLDLMIWCPEVKPHFDAAGWDAELQIKRVGDNGAVCRGIEAGWVWCTTIANYPAEKRQLIYAAAKRDGHTHFALHVAAMAPGPGYHGIYPITQDFANDYGTAMSMVCRELLGVGLIPVSAGVAPGLFPAYGFDASQVKAAMTDWDNSAVAACRIRAVHEAFPNAWVWYELPEGEIYPKPCDCGRGCESVPPTSSNGGAWLHSMLQRYPRFIGLVCEVNAPDGVGANADQLEKIYTWWRDVPINLGEIDTYWKFWDNTPKATAIQHNDTLHAECPWLHGTMSGWTCSPPPPDETTGGDVQPFPGDMINPAAVIVEDVHDLLHWPAAARISRLELRTGHIHIEFTKQTGPGRWPDIPFGQPGDSLQFSMGMCQFINGQWYAAAPIQWWYGLDEWGGPIQNQNVSGTGRGHIQMNWFYNAQWWPHLSQHQPKPGEVIGLYVAAGNVRDRNTPLHERSNIVTFALPAPDQTAVFAWSTA